MHKRMHERMHGRTRERRGPNLAGDGQRGWVTVETAFAALGIGALIVVCVGVFAVCLAWLDLGSAAAEIARQAARDDLTAIQRITDTLPEAAVVSVEREGGLVVVTVATEVRPWGDWLPGIGIQARAVATYEGRVP